MEQTLYKNIHNLKPLKHYNFSLNCKDGLDQKFFTEEISTTCNIIEKIVGKEAFLFTLSEIAPNICATIQVLNGKAYFGIYNINNKSLSHDSTLENINQSIFKEAMTDLKTQANSFLQSLLRGDPIPVCIGAVEAWTKYNYDINTGRAIQEKKENIKRFNAGELKKRLGIISGNHVITPIFTTNIKEVMDTIDENNEKNINTIEEEETER